MKGFGIYVKNDLLDPKHVENMGASPLFLYLWLLDKMTSINENGIGKVLGGKPITYEEVIKEVPMPLSNYRRYMKRLKDTGYINTIRTPHGLSISVNKAYKPFKRSAKNDTSVGGVMFQKGHSDVPKLTQRYSKNDTSNIRQYKDNTKTKDEFEKERQKATEVRQLLEAKGIIKKTQYNNTHQTSQQ